MSTEQAPEVTLPRDRFTADRRRFEGHPEAVKASSRIDVTDPYGNLETWVVDLYRLGGEVTAFAQVGGAAGKYDRIVMPPEVTSVIARHLTGLVTKQRRQVARKIARDKKALGIKLGNPEALKRARKARRQKGGAR